MSADWLFYGDDRTRAALSGGGGRVLMLGSFMGYPNFGDILQLKGALAWHRANTGLAPVLVSDASAITDDGYVERLRRWLGVEAALFCTWERLEGAPAGLEEVGAPARVAHLHMYGGGFLNTLWGEYIVSLAESLRRRFGVGHYVLSGQQVEPEFSARLERHFREFPPLLAGGRDQASAEVLARLGVPAAFSFDDAAGPMAEIAGAVRAGADRGAPDETPNILLHLNVSGYTRAGDAAAALEQLRMKLRALHEAVGGRARVTLLQAYTDRRAHEVFDTLGVVQQLEDGFPFRDHRVLHLDRVAMDYGSECWTTGLAGLGLGGRGIALTCSYHVTMLCQLLGVPCWMESRNTYYRQKRTGLGIAGDDFAAFLREPQVVSADALIAGRSPWEQRLAEAYRVPAGHAPAGSAPSASERPSRRWQPKSSLPRAMASLDEQRRAAEAMLVEQAAAVRAARSRADDLAARAAAASAELHQAAAHAAALEKELARERLAGAAALGRLEELRRTFEVALMAQQARIAELEEANRQERVAAEQLNARRESFIASASALLRP